MTTPSLFISTLAVALISVLGCQPLHAQSLFTQRPDDPGAIVVTPEQFPVKADGVTDDYGCPATGHGAVHAEASC